MADLDIGARVLYKDKYGTVKFVGNTEFAGGKWVGIELDTADGKNSGSVQGVHYFECRNNHGVFVRQSQIQVVGPGEEGGVAPPTTTSPAPSAPTPATPSFAETPAVAHHSQIPTPTPAKSGLKRPTSIRHPETPASARAPIPDTAAVTRTESAGVAGADSMTGFGGVSSPSRPATPEAPETTAVVEAPRTPLAKVPKVPQSVMEGALEEITAECKRLKETVATLEAKREEDAVKLKEAERVKATLEQMSEYKIRWAAAQKEMQQKLREAEKKAKAAEDKMAEMEEEMSGLVETAEMATLDKEMAEEQLELLKTENAQLKEKVEELTLDMEILQAEGPGDGAQVTQGQYKQLEAQCERFRVALAKLRDLAQSEKADMQATIKDLEKRASRVSELESQNEKLEEELLEAEGIVDELKQQVDDALGAEEMVETLTDRNLNLEERIHELEEALGDLEQLQEIQREVESEHNEIIKQLTTDLDFAQAELAETQRKLALNEEAVAEYDQTILKYRNLVVALQESIRSAEASMANEATQKVELANQSQAIMNHYMQLQTSNTKTQARALEMEMRTLDLQQAQRHAALLKNFFPPMFPRQEYNPVRTVLLLDRLVFKADIIVTHVRQQYSLDEVLRGSLDAPAKVSGDLLGFATQLCALMVTYRSAARRIQDALYTCKVEVYQKVGGLFTELAASEPRLNAIVSLLKNEELTPDVPLAEIARAITLFNGVMASNFSQESVPVLTQVREMLAILVAQVDAGSAHVRHAGEIVAGGNVLFAESAKALHQIKVAALKELRRLPEEAQVTGANAMPDKVPVAAIAEDVLTALKSQVEAAVAAVKVFASVDGALQKRLADEPTAGPGQLAGSVAEIVVAQAIPPDAFPPEEFGSGPIVQSLSEAVARRAAAVSKAAEEALPPDAFKIEPPPRHPALLRAKVVADEYGDKAGLRELMEIKEEEMADLSTQIKIRDKWLEEEKMKIAIMDKRAKDLEAELEKMETLRRQLEKAGARERELVQTVDALQADVDLMERRAKELDRQLRGKGRAQPGTLSPMRGMQSPIATSRQGSIASLTPSQRNSVAMDADQITPEVLALATSAQVESMQTAIRHLQEDNTRLRQELARSSLADLPPLPLANTDQDHTLDAIANESLRLLTNVRVQAASAKVVRLVPNKEAKRQLSPSDQLLAQKAAMRQLGEKTKALHSKAVAAMAEAVPGAQSPAQLAAFPTPSFTKALGEQGDKKPHLGRLRVPGTIQPLRGLERLLLPSKRPMTLNHTQFSALHAVFVS